MVELSSSIFTVELAQVNYSFLKGFCELQLPEGERIEYKKEFPAKLTLEKTICAMGNTWGGVILIGVEANKTTNKPMGIPAGIEMTEGLEEKVVNMCLSNISPPLVPEVKVCEFSSEVESKDRAVVFIRVPASHQSPHEIIQTHETLVRTHNRNTSADLKTIERLIRRRDEMSKMASAYSPLCNCKFLQVEEEQFESVVMHPRLIFEPIIFFNKQTDDWLSEVVKDVVRCNERKPSPNKLELFDLRGDGKIRRYGSINNYGHATFQQRVEMYEGSIVIYSSMIFLTKVLRIAKRLYSHFGYFGEITFGFTICNTKNLKFGFPQRRYPFEEFVCESPQIYIERTLSIDEFDNLKKIPTEIFIELCRWFGLVLEEKTVSEIMDEILSQS